MGRSLWGTLWARLCFACKALISLRGSSAFLNWSEEIPSFDFLFLKGEIIDKKPIEGSGRDWVKLGQTNTGSEQGLRFPSDENQEQAEIRAKGGQGGKDSPKSHESKYAISRLGYKGNRIDFILHLAVASLASWS